MFNDIIFLLLIKLVFFENINKNIIGIIIVVCWNIICLVIINEWILVYFFNVIRIMLINKFIIKVYDIYDENLLLIVFKNLFVEICFEYVFSGIIFVLLNFWKVVKIGLVKLINVFDFIWSSKILIIVFIVLMMVFENFFLRIK